MLFLWIAWKKLSGRVALGGMVAGLLVALFLTLSGNRLPFGFHAGVWGLFVNAGVCLLGTLLVAEKTEN